MNPFKIIRKVLKWGAAVLGIIVALACIVAVTAAGYHEHGWVGMLIVPFILAIASILILAFVGTVYGLVNFSLWWEEQEAKYNRKIRREKKGQWDYEDH